MLDVSIVPTASKVNAVRAQIQADCLRSGHDDQRAALIANLVVDLFPHGRRHRVLVVLHSFREATHIMVRDGRDRPVELDRDLRDTLDRHAVRWSTMVGIDGRTTLLEFSRVTNGATVTATAP